MGMTSFLRAASFAVALGAGGVAFADNQAPPTEESSEKLACVTDDTAFKQNGRSAAFVIEVHNACAMRLQCTVSAYIVTAAGPVSGKTTMILPAPGNGEPITKSFAIKIKSAGGMANVSRECKPI